MTTTCSDCGTVLNLGTTDPCPGCGSTAQTYHLQTDDAVHGQTVDEAQLTGVEYKWKRGWTEQWQATVHHLERLRAMYADRNTDNQELVREVDAYFITSLHLYDWLSNDSQTGIREKDVEKYTRGCNALEIGNAYANTRKHLELRRSDRLKAWTYQYTSGPSGCSMSIAYWSSVDPQQTIDALDLAEQCHKDWLAFLNLHGLTPPASA